MDRLFENPNNLTDQQLERELELIPVMANEILGNERIEQCIKQEFINYNNELIQEKQRRDNIIYPLESFDITNWL